MSWYAVGSAVVSVAGAYLSKPKAPKQAELEVVDPDQIQASGLQGNLQNLPAALELSRRAAFGSQQTGLDLINNEIPGFSDLQNRFTELAKENLDDPSRLPDDVTENVKRLTAEMGLNTGIRGQSADFNLARNLGMASVETRSNNIREAMGLLQGVRSMGTQTSIISPFSQLIGANERAQMAIGQNANQQQIAQSGYNNAAMVDNYNSQNIWGEVASGLGGILGSVDWNNLGNGNRSTGSTGISAGTSAGSTASTAASVGRSGGSP